MRDGWLRPIGVHLLLLVVCTVINGILVFFGGNVVYGVFMTFFFGPALAKEYAPLCSVATLFTIFFFPYLFIFPRRISSMELES